jgi:hypothetical protein
MDIYPQYRKYKDNKAFFKIISETEWEEVRIMAEHYSLHSFRVKIMPDRNLLHDMMFDYEGHWEKIGEEEYERVKGKIVNG